MKPKRQNKREFSELIKTHQKIIHKITFVYTNSPADREDLFQEICLQLWESYTNFREESRFSTWMYRVALNTAISNIRKKNKNIALEPLSRYKQIQDDTSGEKDEVKQLYQAISKLNQIDKAIILLWLEEKSYEEIASIMGTSKSNISVKLVRIKRKLEEKILETIKQEP